MGGPMSFDEVLQEQDRRLKAALAQEAKEQADFDRKARRKVWQIRVFTVVFGGAWLLMVLVGGYYVERNKAYWAGYTARQNRVPIEWNPVGIGPFGDASWRDAWYAGWRAAKEVTE